MMHFFRSFFVFIFLIGPTSVWAIEDENGVPPGNEPSWVDKISGPANAPTPEANPPGSPDQPPVQAPAAAAVPDEEVSQLDPTDPAYKEIAQSGGEGLPDDQKAMIELDKLIKEKGTGAILTDPAMAKKIMKAFTKGKGKNAKPMSPFAAVPENEIEALVFKQSEGTMINDLLKKNPKIVTFIVRFFKSEDAFFGLIKIASQDKKLKLYFGTFVFLTLLSFLFNLMGNRKSPFWKRFLRKIFISLFITGMQFVSIYLFFGNELKPTIEIAKQVFFN